MKISEFVTTTTLSDNDYVPISRKSGSVWSSVKYNLISLLERIGFNKSTNKFNASVLPDNVVYDTTMIKSVQLPYTDSAFASNIIEKSVLPIMFERMLNANRSVYNSGSTGYVDVDNIDNVAYYGAILRANGYYPDEKPYTPYFAYGQWMTVNHVWAMLSDRYTPYSGGAQMQSYVNIPIWPKATDTNLSLDYAVCNNFISRVLVLGNRGWDASIRPNSCFRAFDNGINLKAIIGEISLEGITQSLNIHNMFRKCDKLWQFHLANIPDAIEALDLSGCSDAINTPFRYSATIDGAVTTHCYSSFFYLLANCARDITRTKKLTITVNSTQEAGCRETWSNFFGSGVSEFRNISIVVV